MMAHCWHSSVAVLLAVVALAVAAAAGSALAQTPPGTSKYCYMWYSHTMGAGSGFPVPAGWAAANCQDYMNQAGLDLYTGIGCVYDGGYNKVSDSSIPSPNCGWGDDDVDPQAVKAAVAALPRKLVNGSLQVGTVPEQDDPSAMMVCMGIQSESGDTNWDFVQGQPHWTAQRCQKYMTKLHTGTTLTTFQMGCLFADGYSMAAANSEVPPSPNCGWTAPEDAAAVAQVERASNSSNSSSSSSSSSSKPQHSSNRELHVINDNGGSQKVCIIRTNYAVINRGGLSIPNGVEWTAATCQQAAVDIANEEADYWLVCVSPGSQSFGTMNGGLPPNNLCHW